MRRRLFQVAFLLARIVFAAGMRKAIQERKRREAQGVEERNACGPHEQWAVRLGQYVMIAWLYSVWALSSELAWIVLGHDPWWSERRLIWSYRSAST
jgi:hypothetical protein